VGTPIEMAGAATRSHLPDGRCVGWYGSVPAGVAVAVDAEPAAAAVPPALARRFGTRRFWQRWTRTECLCKLAGVPIVVWLAEHGLRPPAEHRLDTAALAGCVWRTLRVSDLVVTIAVARAVTSRRSARLALVAGDECGEHRVEQSDRVVDLDHGRYGVVRQGLHPAGPERGQPPACGGLLAR
jgi:hypothetical protein